MWTVSLLGVCVLCGTTYAFTLLTVWHLMLFMWDHNLNSWHTLYDERSGLASSLIINILLLGFMFIQHTGMASIRLKSFLQDTIGLNSVIIRPLYIAATSCVLQVTINNWRRIPTFTLWSMVELSNDSWWFFFWVHLLSWTLLYGHCLMLDFGEMMGVKQVYYQLINYEEPLDYKSRHLNRLYEHRRHSVLGLFFVLLVHPCMTLDRVLLLVAGIAYVRQFFRVDRLDYDYQYRQLQRKHRKSM